MWSQPMDTITDNMGWITLVASNLPLHDHSDHTNSVTSCCNNTLIPDDSYMSPT